MISQTIESGRKLVKFGDVVKNANLAERDPEAAGIGRVVGLEHLDPENLHIRRWNTLENGTSFTRKFVPGQTLFGKRRAYQRKIAFAEFEGICSGDILTFEPKDPDVLLPELLPFICQTDAFFDHALGTSAGSLSPRTSYKALQDFEFPLPPIEEQKRIAEILWAADEAVENWNKTLHELDLMMSVYRVELFAREQWPTKKLKELFSVQLGKMLSDKARSGDSPRPYLANYNVQWDCLNLDKVQEMDFNEGEREKFALVPGDLLVCEGGEVGRTAIWRGEIQDCYYQKALHRLRPLTGYSSEIMLQFMRWADRKGKFRAVTGHSTIAHLTAIKLKEMEVPVPPDDMQQNIEDTLWKLKEHEHSITAHLEKTTALKKSVLNELLMQESSHV